MDVDRLKVKLERSEAELNELRWWKENVATNLQDSLNAALEQKEFVKGVHRETDKSLSEMRSKLKWTERELEIVQEKYDLLKKDASEDGLGDLQAENFDLKRALEKAERSLERWRHGREIEGDEVCPDSLLAHSSVSELRHLKKTVIPELEAELARCREALERVKAAIISDAGDTVWVGPAYTAVELIEATLSDASSEAEAARK